MPDHIVASSPMAEAELRASVQPIDELLAERSHLIEKCAPLRAVYGSFGTFDHSRKILLSRLKGEIRARAVRDQRKITNDQVDEEAHEHPDFIEFITDATKARTQWIKLEAIIEAIDFKIQRGQAVMRFAASEARLA